MKSIKRIFVFVVMACLLVMTIPISSLAVDPVSAAVMANAAAQAIAAYGASQGVSMSFDVGNTDGIGESVHDLWTQFKEDSQNSNLPTYDSFAVNIWTDLYSKIGDKIGINLSSENVDIVNQFWDWLLSGPAEMQKVDDQYYEFTNNQSIPVVYDSPFSGLVLPETNPINYNWLENNGINAFHYDSYNVYIGLLNNSVSVESYPFFYEESGLYRLVCVMNLNDRVQGKSYSISYTKRSPNYSSKELASIDSQLNLFYAVTNEYYNPSLLSNIIIPIYTTINDGLSAVYSIFTDGMSPSLSVKPYGEQLTVSFPVASPYTGTLDNTWDSTLFGDGTGTLTDAQSTAISNSLSQSLVDSGELTLDTADDINASEVYIPFLPITLPSFNFSLSGIWHYVVSWVESLGAWLSTMFTVWEVVPSAITIPVYASAVIVIVLGVYKRFFM